MNSCRGIYVDARIGITSESHMSLSDTPESPNFDLNSRVFCSSLGYRPAGEGPDLHLGNLDLKRLILGEKVRKRGWIRLIRCSRIRTFRNSVVWNNVDVEMMRTENVYMRYLVFMSMYENR